MRRYRFHLDGKGKVLETPEELVLGMTFQTTTVVHFVTPDGVMHFYPWASLHHVEVLEVEDQAEGGEIDERAEDAGHQGSGGVEPSGVGEAVKG